jgi:protein-tyrosine phosphatase
MDRIDVHCHFLPALDDGCATLEESLQCLRMMVAAGYGRIFCTPHCGTTGFSELTMEEIGEQVRSLQGHVAAAGIPIELKQGGELRLGPDTAEELKNNGEYFLQGIPTYGHRGKYVLADVWEEDWPAWATRGVQALQQRGLTVIIAHPERMPVLRERPEMIGELAALGVLFQGNLGPIAGSDSPDIVALARQFLLEGRYFMVGTDGHRPGHLGQRLAGLKVAEALVGEEKLRELTVGNPGRLWGD